MLSSISGSLLFLFLYLIAGFSLVQGLLTAALVVGGALYFPLLYRKGIIRYRRSRRRNKEPFRSRWEKCRDRIDRIREIVARVDEPNVTSIAREICETAEAILIKIEKDPERIRSLHRFFEYYLDSSLTIVQKCELLLKSPVFDGKMEYQVKQAEQVLTRLKQEFDRQMVRVMERDVLQLEIEVRALEKIMKTDKWSGGR